MKSLLIVTLLFCTQILMSQEFKYINPILNDSCKILSQAIDTNSRFEEIVYIDYSEQSSRIRKSINDVFENNLNQFISINSENCMTNREEVFSLPNKWIEVFSIEKNWVFFKNHDLCKIYCINDTALLEHELDGISVNPITAIYYDTIKTSICFCSLSWNGKNEISTNNKLEIYIIDENNFRSIWKFTRDNHVYFQTMMPVLNACKLPVLNIVSTDYFDENIFDEIEYDKFIN